MRSKIFDSGRWRSNRESGGDTRSGYEVLANTHPICHNAVSEKASEPEPTPLKYLTRF